MRRRNQAIYFDMRAYTSIISRATGLNDKNTVEARRNLWLVAALVHNAGSGGLSLRVNG